MVYKWCVVPQCRNTFINNPEKIFISIPTNPKRRKMWLQLARRDPKSILSHSNIFMCEDHFNMEKAVVNYLKYKMGFSERIILADDAVPTKFNCQEDRKRRLSGGESSRKTFLKRQRINLVTEILQNATETHPKSLQKENLIIPENIRPEELPKTQNKHTTTDLIITIDKSVQITTKVNMHYRSKAVQTKLQNKSISTSPFKVSTTSRFTSHFKIKPISHKPSQLGVIKKVGRKIVLEEEKSESDISCFESDHLSTFVASSSSRLTDSDSNVSDYTNENIKQLQSLKNTLRYIEKKPMIYVGIRKGLNFFIKLVHKNTNIKIEHILLCLKKIRMHYTFSELEDNFGISLSYASKIFLRNIPILSSVLEKLIVKLDTKLIRKNLPIAFRYNYYNVSCIIDCLEIDIQKPSKALHQALTWSDYKKGNTVKYLISCTPNGLVNFVSKGFGGRTSDVAIVENSNFLDGLETGTCILADRGFKHLEQILHENGMTLVRPPRVKAGEKLSKLEVRQTKIIASLRIHIERVIRRLREFHMLKQHSVINVNVRRVLDHVIIVACDLINLQDSLIK